MTETEPVYRTPETATYWTEPEEHDFYPRFPEYSKWERLADATIHVIGVVSGLIAVVALFIVAAPHGDAWTITSLTVYAIGMLAMFTCSALYHLTHRPKLKTRYRRWDHAAIFLKIAGTYTPFMLVKLGGGLAAGLMSGVWAIALIGAPLQLFAPALLARIGVWLYLGQGWLVVFAISPLTEVVSATAGVLVITGGLLYTVGVVFHLWERLPFSNAIWHFFVLVATFCFYAAILNEIALPAV
ncbi:MAG: hemolysin III family protein [Pseudomonadota bacterium]